MGDEVRPDDLEMAALRELAAEVVSAAGGVPVRRGYRPRLDPGGVVAVSPRELVATLAGLASSARRRPRRTLGLALAGCGALAAGVLLVRAALLPGDASLELIAARPAPLGASVPAPPAPPETMLVEAPSRAAAPPPAPAPPVQPAPVSAKEALRALTDPKPGKRAGRRSDAALAVAARTKSTRVPTPARTHKEASASGLDRRAIVAGMQPVQLLVQRCYQRYGEKGVANAGIEVGKRGEVKKVTIAGPLARTSTAACLKSAVKTAHFQGGSMTFHYPLVVQ
jgi:hypothetical protein